MVLFLGLTMVTMPSQTNALNQLPKKFYADGSASINTLNQVAGAAGTAIAITLFTSGQSSHLTAVPGATDPEVLAAGVKYAFYFITGISIVALLCSFFMRTKGTDQQTSPEPLEK